MEIEKTEIVKVNVKTLKLHLKVSDRFCAELISETGKSLLNYEGYVPSFMPEDHFGDYVILDIDIDTGQITNWSKPSASAIEAWIENSDV